jgi:nucleoside-diphosphate-sugar epimerase
MAPSFTSPRAGIGMDILVMGGTRFVGKPLVEHLLAAGHALSLFTRGNKPAPAGVEHLIGDRSTPEGLQPLDGRRFDVIVDSSGRTLEDSRAVVERTGAPSHRFVYVSSAGVYADSELWPLDEDSPTDPASRHAGKAETEAWLRSQGIPFTSFRPTYIVGPGNYNPVESWFFDRIVHGRPVPLPGDGSTITQLGHVRDLACAMARCIEVDAAANRIYNCSGPPGCELPRPGARRRPRCRQGSGGGGDPQLRSQRARQEGPQGLPAAASPLPHRHHPGAARTGLGARL